MALRMTNNEKDLLDVIDENFGIMADKINSLCEKLENANNQATENELLERLTKAQELFERLSKEKSELIKGIIEKYN